MRHHLSSGRGRRAAIALAALFTPFILASSASAQPKPDAAALYRKHCLLCHGSTGSSPMPNASFADGIWKHGSTPKAVETVITDGVKGTVMQPFAGKLTPAEIKALASHVRAYDKALKPGK